MNSKKDMGPDGFSMPSDEPASALDRLIDTLIEKDRLGYLGGFIRGFIHNINGPLQNMSMLSDVLLKGLDQQDKLFKASSDGNAEAWDDLAQKQRTRFLQLGEQITMLATIIRNFMVIHEIERKSTETDLNLVLHRLAGVFQADLFFKHQVKVDFELTGNLPLVRIPGRDMIPALVYLLRNAVTALKGASEKTLIIRSLYEGEKISVVLQDSGCGIPNNGAGDDLFELFSSRWPDRGLKPEERETHFGFGLYAVRRLLDPYGVCVRIESEPGATRTVVEIPESLCV